MASRTFLLLVVVACAVLAVTARKEGPAFEASTGKSLLQYHGGSGGNGAQGQHSAFNPYVVEPYGYQPYEPYGYPGYNPYEPLQVPPYNPYNPYQPQQPEPHNPGQPQTLPADPYVPFEPNFGGYPGSHSMCPDRYMVTYGANGIECMPIPQPEPTNSKYPPRDPLSIERCPVGEVYRYMTNGHTACLPESFVYEGIYNTAAAAAPPPAEE